jgi:hypothetical protein
VSRIARDTNGGFRPRLGVPRGPDLRRQWLTDGNKKRPGSNEAVAAVRAGDALAVPKPSGSPGLYPMLENIAEDMARLSHEFRLPTGMTRRI